METIGEHTHKILENSVGMRLQSRRSFPGEGAPAHVVPENSLFVLGDYRDNASDSRLWGEVPFNLVEGKNHQGFMEY